MFDVREMFARQGDGAFDVLRLQRLGDRRVLVDAAQREPRRLEGGHHQRRARQQLAQKARQLGAARASRPAACETRRTVGSRPPDRPATRPRARRCRCASIRDMIAAFNSLASCGEDAGFEDAMRSIDGANFFRRRMGNEHASLRNALQPPLGDQAMQDLADALARNVENASPDDVRAALTRAPTGPRTAPATGPHARRRRSRVRRGRTALASVIRACAIRASLVSPLPVAPAEKMCTLRSKNVHNFPRAQRLATVFCQLIYSIF